MAQNNPNPSLLQDGPKGAKPSGTSLLDAPFSGFSSITAEGKAPKTPFVGVTETAPALPSSVEKYLARPTFGSDLYATAAMNQSTLDALGTKLSNILPNVAAGLLRDAGHLYNLIPQADTNQDYNNALIEIADSMRDPFGQVLRENPADIMDLTEGKWWIENLGSLAETAGEFYITGAGVGSLFAKGAKAATGALELSSEGAKIARWGAARLTASTLGYTEGAMIGNEVYKATFKKAFDKAFKAGLDAGMSPFDAERQAKEKAKVVGANAASTATTIATIAGSLLNFSSVGAMFRTTEAEVQGWMRTFGKKQAGESLTEWSARLARAANEDGVLGRILRPSVKQTLVKEALQEGIEELTQNYAEKAGYRQAEKERPLIDHLVDLENYLKDAFTEEGLVNFALGALGGVGQTALMENIPMFRVTVGENGQAIQNPTDPGQVIDQPDGTQKYATKLVSARTRDAMGNERMYNSSVAALGKDITWYQSTMKDLNAAVESKNHIEAEKLRIQLTHVGNLNAIQMGIADAWVSEYQRIASLDNTELLKTPIQAQLDEVVAYQSSLLGAVSDPTQLSEEGQQEYAALEQQKADLQTQLDKVGDNTAAMQAGYTGTAGSEDYKNKAQRAIKDIQYLTKLWDDTQTAYNSGLDEKHAQVARHVFAAKANIYSQTNFINELETDIAIQRTNLDQFVPTTQQSADIQAMVKVNKTEQAAIDILTNDLSMVRGAIEEGNLESLEGLIRKYSVPGKDLDEGVRNLGKTLDELIAQRQQAQNSNQEALENTLGYTNWKEKNPNKSFEDFTNSVKETGTYSAELDNLQDAVNELKLQRDAAANNLAKITSKSGITAITSAYAAERKRLEKELNERFGLENEANVLENQTKENIAKIVAANKTRKINELQAYIQERTEKLVAVQADIEAIETSEKQASLWARVKGLSKKAQLMTLTGERSILLFQIREARRKIENIQEAPVETAVVTEPEIEETEQETTGIPIEEEPIVETPEPEIADETTEAVPDVPEQEFEEGEIPTEFADLAAELGFEAEPTTYRSVEEIIDKSTMETITASVELGVNGNIPMETTLDAIKTILDVVADNMTEPEWTDVIQPWILNIAQTINSPNFTELAEIADRTPAGIWSEVESAFQKVLSGEANFDYDMFGPAVAKGFSAVDAQKMLWYVEKELQRQSASESPIMDEAPEESSYDTAPLEELYIPPVPEPDSTITVNEPIIQTITENPQSHEGIKTKVGNKLAVLQLRYAEGKNEKGNFVKINLPNSELVEGLYPGLLLPDGLQPGTALVLKLDRGFEGQTGTKDIIVDEGSIPERTYDAFTNYLEADGVRIKTDEASIASVPIRVEDSAGNYIAHLHTVPWIKAKYPNTDDYRNVLDEYSVNGELISGNVEAQASLVTKLRKQLVAQFNSGKTELRTTVKEKGVGQFIINMAKTDKPWASKVEYLPTATLMPGPVEFGIIQNGEIQVGRNTPTERSVYEHSFTKTSPNGSVVALVPMANGQYEGAPIQMPKMSQNDVDTIILAIEQFLDVTGDTTKADEIRDKTGFNITTAKGLKAFINQFYTYTQEIKEETLVADAPVGAEGRVSKFVFDVEYTANGRGQVVAGVTYSGTKKAIAALGHDGKLEDGFKALLMKHLAGLTLDGKATEGGRYKHVVFSRQDLGWQGVNSPLPITEVTYYPKSGKLKNKTHASYNDYLKSFTTTYVDGRNTVAGQHIYAVHGTVEFDVLPVFETKIETPVEEISISEVTPMTETVIDVELAQEWDDIFGSPREVVQKTLYRPSIKISEGIPTTVENLQNLANFTPVENRNQRTVGEVKQELDRLGITSLLPNYNPFYSC